MGFVPRFFYVFVRFVQKDKEDVCVCVCVCEAPSSRPFWMKVIIDFLLLIEIKKKKKHNKFLKAIFKPNIAVDEQYNDGIINFHTIALTFVCAY